MKTTETQNTDPHPSPNMEKANAVRQGELSGKAFAELRRGVLTALETYSNVHRGTGYNSIVSTQLYEQSRDLVLQYLGLDKRKYRTVFCSSRRAEAFKVQLEPGAFSSISGNDIGLSLGVTALAVKRKAFPKGIPFEAGGGNSRLISRDWVVWARVPDKFEAGTPAIINIITFAKALDIIRRLGNNPFKSQPESGLSVAEILYHDEFDGLVGGELLAKLRNTFIGNNAIVPALNGKRRFINLDNAASTPTYSAVAEAFFKSWRLSGQLQKEITREVRSVCDGFLGTSSSAHDIIFTSNTTEAINLVAQSYSREAANDCEPVLLSSLLEHSSNDLPWRLVPGLEIVRLSVSDEGFIDPEELGTVMHAYNQDHSFGAKRIKLVALSGASNVLGVFNNLDEISTIVHSFGARLLVDAAQLAAHRRIEMETHNIDYLAFSAHKVYAPFGCGVLAARKGVLNFSTAEMEHINSSGEENTAGIAALGKVLVHLQRIGLDVIEDTEKKLTKKALLEMAQVGGLRIYGVQRPDSIGFARKSGVIVFNIKGIISASLAKELALFGIGVRFGCHCAHILIKHLLGVSPGLERFQRIIISVFPKLQLPGLARVSFGIENSQEDIETLVQALGNIANKLQSKNGTQSTTDKSDSPGLSRTEVQKLMKEFALDAGRKVFAGPEILFKHS